MNKGVCPRKTVVAQEFRIHGQAERATPFNILPTGGLSKDFNWPLNHHQSSPSNSPKPQHGI